MKKRDLEKTREYERKWYATPEGKAKRLAINERRRDRQRDWFEQLKIDMGGCNICGEAHPATLDFHHLSPAHKTAGISEMVKNASRAKILEEIKKCVLLCANCHRKVHYHERKRERLVIKHKKKCADDPTLNCGKATFIGTAELI